MEPRGSPENLTGARLAVAEKQQQEQDHRDVPRPDYCVEAVTQWSDRQQDARVHGNQPYNGRRAKLWRQQSDGARDLYERRGVSGLDRERRKVGRQRMRQPCERVRGKVWVELLRAAPEIDRGHNEAARVERCLAASSRQRDQHERVLITPGLQSRLILRAERRQQEY